MSRVLLELSDDEARVLYAITGVFNGCVHNSPRKHTDAIYHRLNAHFGQNSLNMVERQLLPMALDIRFQNYPVTKTPQQLKIEELENTINEAQKQLQELKGL